MSQKILVFYTNQPCLDITTLDVAEDTPNYGRGYGLNRDRNPDIDWTELRNTSLKDAKQVDLIPELKQILIEDLAYAYGNNTALFSSKMKEFNLF